MKNKKGTEKILSVYWFVILFITAAAIASMVIIFYGEPYDVRQIEANILVNKIADCLSDGENLRQEVMEQSFKDNFLENCNLNFESEDMWEEEQYYIEIENLNIIRGNINLKDSCGLSKETSVVCVERQFYILDKDNKGSMIKILSIIRKTEKNVK
jgi:hypothetical protein